MIKRKDNVKDNCRRTEFVVTDKTEEVFYDMKVVVSQYRHDEDSPWGSDIEITYPSTTFGLAKHPLVVELATAILMAAALMQEWSDEVPK